MQQPAEPSNHSEQQTETRIAAADSKEQRCEEEVTAATGGAERQPKQWTARRKEIYQTSAIREAGSDCNRTNKGEGRVNSNDDPEQKRPAASPSQRAANEQQRWLDRETSRSKPGPKRSRCSAGEANLSQGEAAEWQGSSSRPNGRS